MAAEAPRLCEQVCLWPPGRPGVPMGPGGMKLRRDEQSEPAADGDGDGEARAPRGYSG